MDVLNIKQQLDDTDSDLSAFRSFLFPFSMPGNLPFLIQKFFIQSKNQEFVLLKESMRNIGILVVGLIVLTYL